MNALNKFMAEAVGTFVFCFVGAGAICAATYMTKTPNKDFGPIASYVTLIGIAAAHGLILSIVVSATMNISGGHINPAVTVCMLLTRRISALGAFQYIVAQLAGAVAAGGLVVFFFGNLSTPAGDLVVSACQLGTPNVSDNIDSTMAVLIEMAGTFVLVFAIFGTAVDPRAPKLGGWGIGLAVASVIFVIGPLTGASMNPARTFGPGLVAALNGDLSAFWEQQWIYWVGPIVGAIIAAFVYDKAILERSPVTR
ncbi:MAG TPA: aquaporin [Phycisphaerae bacterium]|nr:aquaporin [Phycisphaerae bacterium]